MPASLTEADVRLLTSVLDRLSQVRSPGAFPEQALAASATVVPCDIATYNEVSVGGSFVRWWPDDDLRPRDSEALISQYAYEHPLINEIIRTGDGSARAISDFLSPEEFRRLHLYRLFFEPFGLADQLAIGLPAARPLIIGIALNRGRRGFSGRERLMADLLRPYLVQAHRSLQLAAALEMATTVGLDNRAAFVVNAGGRLESITGATPAWLPVEELFPAARLTDEASAWFEAQRNRPARELPALAAPLVVRTARGRWILRYVATRAGPVVVVVRGREDDAADQAVLEALGLTPREAEVMRLLSAGASNPRIADTLGVSQSTVKRHLEATYRKLGVRNRSEATALVVDTLAHS